jgi:hypothetical protein
MNAKNPIAVGTYVLYCSSGECPPTSGARSLSGTPASAGHKDCDGTLCVMAITERHQVAETDAVARCADRRNRRGREKVDTTTAACEVRLPTY